MIQLNSDLIELLEAFEKFGVRYLVIGGYAVSYHAEPRYTKDIDFWIATDRRNAEAVHTALRHFGAPLHGGGPDTFEDEDAFYSFGAAPNRVDIMMGPQGGGSFDDAWARRVTEIVQGVAIHFVNRADLVKLKTAAGRAVDRRDLRSLERSDPLYKSEKPKSSTRKSRGPGRT